MSEMLLPLGLRRLFEQYTADANETGMSLEQAFEDYVGGSDARLMQFVRSKASGGGRRATLCPRYHAVESACVSPCAVCY